MIYSTGGGRLAQMAMGSSFPMAFTDLQLDLKRRNPDNMLNPYSGEADFSPHSEYSPGFRRFGNQEQGAKRRTQNAYARALGSSRLSLFGS